MGGLGNALDCLRQALALDLGKALVKGEEGVHCELRLSRVIRLWPATVA